MLKRLRRLLAGSVRRQLIVGMVLVVASTMSLFVWDMTRRQQGIVLEQQTDQAIALARSVSASSAVWVAARDFSGLQEIVMGLSQYPDLSYAIVLDLEGQVLAHSDAVRRGLYLTDLPHKPETTVLHRTANQVDVVSPIRLGGNQIGWVWIGLARDSVDAKLAQVTRSGLVYALVAIALSALFAVLAGRYLTRRLYAIQQVADAVLAGKSGLRARVSGYDEATHLARQFNSMLDILAQREEEVRQLAFYDTLTELPNRRLLTDRLSQTMAASARSACYGALMFLDLDNFKPLNDLYGHEVGDLLLIEVAHRLKNCIREVDTVARFGGDEFVVMISELDVDESESVTQAGLVAEKVRLALAEPYRLCVKREGATDTTIEHHCTASIGVVLFINHASTQEEILKAADSAMYQAKAAGRNSAKFYSIPERDANS